MAANDSHYLHTSLYAFTESASAAVIARFRDAITEDAITCFYQVATETFYLNCPREKGAMADGILSQVIEDFINTELEAAQHDKRLPTVLRYPESTFDELGSFAAKDDCTIIAAQQPVGQIARTQIVIAPDSAGQVVKLFYLHELQSYGLLERCLGTNQKLMSTGQVCRATRWTNTDGHIFSGRTSGGRESHARVQSALQLPSFVVLRDRRAGIVPGQETTRQGFEFVTGQEDTTVKQWLAGTGETQTTSEDSADIPRDAEQFLAASHSHTLGRARVPQGLSVILVDDPTDGTDSSTDSSSEHHNDFAALLPGTRLTPSLAECTGFPASHKDHSWLERTVSSAHKDQVPPTTTGGTTSALKVPEYSVMGPSSRGLSEQQARSSTSQRPSEEWKRKPERNYSAVDHGGLTGDVTNTAKWENENAVPVASKKKKLKDNRVVPRTTSKSGMHSSNGSQTGSQANISTSSNTAPTVVLNHCTPTDYTDATWPDESTLTRRMHTKPLVDYPKLDQGSSSLKLSPGMLYALGAPQEPSLQPPQDSQDSDRPVQLVEVLGDDSHMPVNTSSVRPSVGGLLVPQSLGNSRSYAASSKQDDEEEPIIESVQPPRPDVFTKRFDTMRQRAGHSLKAKAKDKMAGKDFKVQLELPEPPPMPKSKRPQQHSGEAGQGQQMVSSRNEDTAEEGASSAHARLRSSRNITKENHPFGEVLRGERLKQQAQDEDDDVSSHCSRTKLVGRAGILLLRPGDREQALNSSAQDPFTLQTELRETSIRTDFLPRVTTSMDDAAVLINAAWSGNSASISKTSHCALEILIRETAIGHLLKVVVPLGQDSPDRAQYSIYTREGVVAEACLHYAVHVYDAQISLLQPGVEYKMSPIGALDSFIASMDSDGDGEPPSFRAKVPASLFTVEKVLAKRIVEIFSMRDPGMVFKLSEVQDLAVGPLDSQNHNMRALARSRKEMTEEQRYWWECLWETADLTRADELQECVHGLIVKMDDVGRYNQGPFVVSEDYRSDDGIEVIEQPFW